MGLDIRYPIGAMFSIIGLLMLGYGLATAGDPMYQRSLGININVWWGCLLLVFGVLMLAFARKGTRDRGNEDRKA